MRDLLITWGPTVFILGVLLAVVIFVTWYEYASDSDDDEDPPLGIG